MGTRSFIVIGTCMVVMTVVFTLLSMTMPPEASADDGSTERADHTTPSEFPPEWFYGGRTESVEKRQGEPAPALTVDGWTGAAQYPADLVGTIVVVFFWSSDSPVCRAALKKINSVHERFHDRNVVCIGVHASNERAPHMKDMLAHRSIGFVNCVDIDNSSADRWAAKWSPTCAVIDQQGVLRALGVHPNHVADVVERLMNRSETTEQPRGE